MKVGLVAVLFPCLLALGWGTPLDDYVNKPDPTYKYVVLSKYKGPDYTLLTINMTSQTWMPDWQSQPVWWHYLSLVIPDKITHPDAGFLFIDGGSNEASPPEPKDTFVALVTVVAVSTNTIGANLKMIPNEPIVFKDDPEQKRRTEDAIIAWTWKTFVNQNGSNPEVLLRMPMTKAAVRAMDTMADVTKQQTGNTVARFMVSGASKRGWTTWTTGAVDKRVVAIAPIVMDLLNMQENLHHYYRSLGGWTFAFGDYYTLNFTQDLDNPAIKQMAAIIDPISYTDRYLNMPKLITSTGGDEFFMVDDSRFYKDQLKGPTYFRQIPNCEHSILGHETSLMFSIRAFYYACVTVVLTAVFVWLSYLKQTIQGGLVGSLVTTKYMYFSGPISSPQGSWVLAYRTQVYYLPRGETVFNWSAKLPQEGSPIPKMSWVKEVTPTGGRITLMTDTPPTTVHAYHATTVTAERKDFRLLRGDSKTGTKPTPQPVFWFSQYATPLGNNTYQVEFPNPPSGWTAFFIQVTFAQPDATAFEFTTETLIIPDTYPFPECHGDACRGVLV